MSLLVLMINVFYLDHNSGIRTKEDNAKAGIALIKVRLQMIKMDQDRIQGMRCMENGWDDDNG